MGASKNPKNNKPEETDVATTLKAWAELTAEMNAPCETCEIYMSELVKSVHTRLMAQLSRPPTEGGINLHDALEYQDPLQILSKKNVGQLRTFKEHWRWDTCRSSLEVNGLYEALGNLFWIGMQQPFWRGEQLPATDLTYGQVAAGRQMWSDEKFMRSASDPSNRHYLMSEALPTAVVSMTDVPKSAGVGFIKMPCLGARGVLAGFY